MDFSSLKDDEIQILIDDLEALEVKGGING